MSNGFATPLRLELRLPRWWAWLLGLGYAAALLMLLWLPLAWGWRLPLLGLWLTGAWFSMAPLLAPRRLARIERAVWGEGDDWQLYFSDGRWLAARLLAQTFCAGSCLQLQLRTPEGRALPLLILPGMLDAASLRRLRVRLRLFTAGTADTTASRRAP